MDVCPRKCRMTRQFVLLIPHGILHICKLNSDTYSIRKARTGSMLAARLAGTMVANTTAIKSTTPTMK